MRALLSFCNEKRAPDEGVLLFDVAANTGTWLAVGTDREIMGTRGICLSGETVYVLYTIGWHETHLSIYHLQDAVPALRADVVLPDVKDPHSLCIQKKQLLITSTGTDELLAYDLDDFGAPLGNARVVWSASSANADTHHINCVTVNDGHVYVSAFGPREGEFWSSATNGYIYDLTANEKACTGIRQPHSLRGANGGIYFAESSRQMLRTLDGASILIGGYARGCDIAADGVVLVGSNVARRVSASRGIVVNNAALENNQEGEAMGKCCVVCVTPGRVPKRQYVDVSRYGREIYDICLLPAEPTAAFDSPGGPLV
jgi:hypothetical protein